MHQALLFILSVVVLGIIGVIGIYVKFITVLISILVCALKSVYDSMVGSVAPAPLPAPGTGNAATVENQS